MDTNKLTELFSRALDRDCMIVGDGSDSSPYKIKVRSTLEFNEFEKFKDDCEKFLSQYGIATGALISVPEKSFTIQILPDEGLSEKLEALNQFIQLQEAARSGSSRVFKELLHEGIKVDTSNISGKTLLFSAAILAVYTDSFCDIELLLEHKININHQDNDGATALHIVIGLYSEVTHGYVKTLPVIAMLLNKGADVTIKTHDGETALQVADRVKDAVAGEMLIDALLKKVPTTEKPSFKMQELSDYWEQQVKKITDKSIISDTIEGAVGGTERALGVRRIENIIRFFSQATIQDPSNTEAAEQQVADVKPTAANLGK